MTTVMLVAGSVALALDLATKRLAVGHLDEGKLYGWSGSWGLRLVRNRRGGWAAMPLGAAALLWFALVVSAIALGPVNAPSAGGLGLVLGGAAGNLLERCRRRAVIDLVALGPWPVFNLADAAMLAGAATVIGGLV